MYTSIHIFKYNRYIHIYIYMCVSLVGRLLSRGLYTHSSPPAPLPLPRQRQRRILGRARFHPLARAPVPAEDNGRAGGAGQEPDGDQRHGGVRRWVWRLASSPVMHAYIHTCGVWVWRLASFPAVHACMHTGHVVGGSIDLLCVSSIPKSCSHMHMFA